ncbi:MAG: hypothetical protein FLDDKLPJ_03004 [Phycisphaerae bacterium]|nr:hypothetical protein [Phycisphaerae bacterium]
MAGRFLTGAARLRNSDSVQSVQLARKFAGVKSFDLFYTYRFVLTVFVSVYAALGAAAVVRRWAAAPLSGRAGRVLWRYAGLLVLRMRVGPFVKDVVLITALTGILALLAAAHAR